MKKTKFGYFLCGMFLLLAAAMFMPVDAEGAVVTSNVNSGRTTNWIAPTTWNIGVPGPNAEVQIGGTVSAINPGWLVASDPEFISSFGHAVTLNARAPLAFGTTLFSVSLGGALPIGVGAGLGPNGGWGPSGAGFGTLTIGAAGELHVQNNITLGGASSGNIFITGAPPNIGIINITGGGAIHGNPIPIGGNAITFNHTGLDYRFYPNITGNVNVIQQAGVTELRGTNNSHVNTTISGGVLAFMPNALQNSTGTITVNNGTLRWLSSATFGGPPFLNVGIGNLDVPGGANATIGAPIIGAQTAVVKQGTGTLTINANQTTAFLSSWVIEAGTLAVGPTFVLNVAAGTTTFDVGAEGTLSVGGMLNVDADIGVQGGNFIVNGGTVNVTAGDVDVESGGNFIVNNNGVVNIDAAIGNVVNVEDSLFIINPGGVVNVTGGGPALILNSPGSPAPQSHLDPNNHIIYAGGMLNIDAGSSITVAADTGLVIYGNFINNNGTIYNYGTIWIPHDFVMANLGSVTDTGGVAGTDIRRMPHGAGLPGGGGGGIRPPGGDDGLLSQTSPSRAWATVNNERHMGSSRQTNYSFLITVPAGTNLAAVPVSFDLPRGATITPANHSVQNFSAGAVTYTVTAANGITTNTYTVRVVIEGEAGAPGTPGGGGENNVNGGGSGSSGCNAGFAALALLLAVPFFFRKRS